MGRILDIDIEPHTTSEISEKVQYCIKHQRYTSIFSLNPEILVLAHNDKKFRNVLNEAEIKIVDGVGVELAGKLLNVNTGQRITGVDLMQELIELANKDRLNVLILGGFATVASDLAYKLQNKYQNAKFKGDRGYKRITSPSSIEEIAVQKVLKDFKPHLVFVAFGAPGQELWVDSHKQFLNNSAVMAVGGAVDFLEGKVQRAPQWMRSAGLEWLYRLILQPWRWKRQLKLITFIRLVLGQKLKG